MIYLLDTTTITDLIEGDAQVTDNLIKYLNHKDRIGLCPPVDYEVQRGLLAKNLQKKLRIFRMVILPRLEWFSLDDSDWLQATQFWVNARQAGRQLSDIDILLSALAHRLNTVIVSSDSDFDALSTQRQDWRVKTL